MSRIIVVHLSDLHVGSGLIGTRTSNAGLDGHEILYCALLQNALRNVRVKDFAIQPGETLHFIVSGDYTRTGSDNDFYLQRVSSGASAKTGAPRVVHRRSTTERRNATPTSVRRCRQNDETNLHDVLNKKLSYGLGI
jgi:hypothetical protein